MKENTESPVRTNWFSPRRLHDSPTRYEFPGDRFIPNRSLMNLDQAHSLLTSKIIREVDNSSFSESYREKMKRNLTLDLEGRPFKMMVFRGSPKFSRRSSRLIDEMRRDDAEALNDATKPSTPRCFPQQEARILNAPFAREDFYANIIDWGNNNTIAAALGSGVYLWNTETNVLKTLFKDQDIHVPTSLAWSEAAESLAIGYDESVLQLWDAETSKCILRLEGHSSRVIAISWKGSTVTSGNEFGSIINHDGRVGKAPTCRIKTAHTKAVCGLKWSSESNLLASGGNDNIVQIWERSTMSSSKSLHRFSEHSGAIKALAWCPYQFGLLATGGGSTDGSIKIWNTQRGTCIDSVDTKAQICGLEWNRHHKEILSGHGFGIGVPGNHLSLWKYPSLTKITDLRRHFSRVINLSQSPDGLTAVSIGGDETLRFWDIFGPPRNDNPKAGLGGLLSLKISPIR